MKLLTPGGILAMLAESPAKTVLVPSNEFEYLWITTSEPYNQRYCPSGERWISIDGSQIVNADWKPREGVLDLRGDTPVYDKDAEARDRS